MKTSRLTLLVVSLAACKRAEEPGRPQLFVDPGRVDLAVDTPLDTFRTADVALVNVGDGPAHLLEVTLTGEHAALVAFESPAPVDLAPGEVLRLTAALVDAGDPYSSPFWEELALDVTAEDPESGDAIEASGIVEVGTLWACDADDDGFIALSCGGDDCDDETDQVNPNMIETCDGIDDDCDGDVDEDDAIDAGTWYPDVDQDRFGDDTAVFRACEPPPGVLDYGGDCDDADPNVFPGGIEVCNTKDDDCDGRVDVDAIDSLVFNADRDRDAFGDPADVLVACVLPDGYAYDATDCDDAVPTTYPGAAELCNGLDDDCDGTIDDDAIGQIRVFADVDGDQHGDPSAQTLACGVGPGQATSGDDCDDAVATTFPGAIEICNAVDDDCNGTIDDNLQIRVFADVDGDQHGDPATPLLACGVGPGQAASGDDCDDHAASTYPGAPEFCDHGDQDCDGVADNGLPFADYYADVDEDTYGATAQMITHCAQPAGYVLVGGDCDDEKKSVHPGAAEVCDGKDQDCDGILDNNATDAKTWHFDADADTYGGPLTVVACAAPTGTVGDGTDCDDTVASINPAGIEVCNGKDDNCNGQIDDAVQPAWFTDADGDTFGDKNAPVLGCAQPPGTVADATDCDDKVFTTNPIAPELCNGIDDDCDGTIDDGTPTNGTWFPDADNDTFGDTKLPTKACAQPPNTIVDGTDCDDTNKTVNPAAIELCNNKDDNCNGIIDDGAPPPVTWYTDSDLDTFGDKSTAVTSCDQPPGSVTDGTDCDDRNAAINPAALEVCNGKDDDCDGVIDDGVPLPATWYTDADVDTFGDPATGVTSCSPPPGAVKDNTDCNDRDATVNPAAVEQCNGKDDDCDGKIDDGVLVTDWFADRDGDTYGTKNNVQSSCKQPAGFVASSTDCDDTNPAVNPAAKELCNGKDDNCNGSIDEGAVTKAWFADADRDSYGDPNTTLNACAQPPGYIIDASDCDDTDPTVNPSAVDSCLDGRDRNCDGVFDACDGCHVFEPVDQPAWTKKFRVTYQGSNGSEVQTAVGPAIMPDGRDGYAVHTTMTAGQRGWDVDNYELCDSTGQLLQAGSSGTVTDPAYGTITMTSEDLPSRIVLPAATQVGSGVTWSFSYVLATTVVPNFAYDLPTNGTSRDTGLETITVPAGTFLAWRIESRWNQDNSSWGGTQDRRQSTFWYAEGVGLIRERTIDRNTNAVVMQKELTGFAGLTPPAP